MERAFALQPPLLQPPRVSAALPSAPPSGPPSPPPPPPPPPTSARSVSTVQLQRAFGVFAAPPSTTSIPMDKLGKALQSLGIPLDSAAVAALERCAEREAMLSAGLATVTLRRFERYASEAARNSVGPAELEAALLCVGGRPFDGSIPAALFDELLDELGSKLSSEEWAALSADADPRDTGRVQPEILLDMLRNAVERS